MLACKGMHRKWLPLESSMRAQQARTERASFSERAHAIFGVIGGRRTLLTWISVQFRPSETRCGAFAMALGNELTMSMSVKSDVAVAEKR